MKQDVWLKPGYPVDLRVEHILRIGSLVTEPVWKEAQRGSGRVQAISELKDEGSRGLALTGKYTEKNRPTESDPRQI